MTSVRLASARLVDSPQRGTGVRLRRGMRVLLEDDAGHVGFGEASPLPGRSRETFEVTRERLGAWGRALPETFELSGDIADTIADLCGALSPLEQPAARFAAETALFDLAGQVLSQPVAAMLGGGAEPAPVPLNATLDGEAILAGTAPLDALVRRGFRAFKVKASRLAFDAQYEALAALREHLGSLVSVRLDVGGKWTLDEAPAHLEALVSLGLEYVEQPVAADELPRLVGSPVPLAADESVELRDGLAAVLEAHNCAAVVLKPALVGGLLRARALAREAQQAGLAVVVTHAFDGPVGLAAAVELALSLDPPPRACGLARHLGLGAWPPIALPQLEDARVRAIPGAGLRLPRGDVSR